MSVLPLPAEKILLRKGVSRQNGLSVDGVECALCSTTPYGNVCVGKNRPDRSLHRIQFTITHIHVRPPCLWLPGPAVYAKRAKRHAANEPAAHGTRAPGVSRTLCERQSESTHVLRQAGAARVLGAGGSGRGCDPATHRADVLLGVAVEVVEEQPVADQHGRHDGEHAGPAREVGEDARVEEVSPHRQRHRRAGEMPAPAQQGAQKEAGSAGEEGLQEARSAGGGVAGGTGLQDAGPYAGSRGTRTRACYRRGVGARAGW